MTGLTKGRNKSLPMKVRAGEHSCRPAALPIVEALRQPLSRAAQTKHEEFGTLIANLQLGALRAQAGPHGWAGR